MVSVFALYFNQLYCRDWLTGRAYYLLQLEPTHVENPEQRIQDDIGLLANLSLDLVTGVLNAIVTLASFLVRLWTLSGILPLRFAGFTLAIPGYMVWVALLYAVPVVGLNAIPGFPMDGALPATPTVTPVTGVAFVAVQHRDAQTCISGKALWRFRRS